MTAQDALILPLEEETIIQSLTGKSVAMFMFLYPSTTLTLTNKRVYQEIKGSGVEEIRVIPIKHIDSFGIETKQHLLLCAIGILLTLFALMQQSFFLIVFGLAVLAAWWFTRKITSVIYSFSGKTEISFITTAENKDVVAAFLHQVNTVMENNGQPQAESNE